MKVSGFPMGWGHNELKLIWCIVGQQTFCHKVVSFLLFCLFFVEEQRWLRQVLALLVPSVFIGNLLEDWDLWFSMKRKGQYSRIAFCMNLAQLFILLYLRTLWKMFPSKNSHALICFSSTIDRNTDTVHLIEGLVFKWKSHTLGSGRRITVC